MLDKTVLPSAFEQMRDRDGLEYVMPWVFQKAVVTVAFCEKCGKLRHYVDRNPK
jgi:hypothetical protein